MFAPNSSVDGLFEVTCRDGTVTRSPTCVEVQEALKKSRLLSERGLTDASSFSGTVGGEISLCYWKIVFDGRNKYTMWYRRV